MGIHRTLLRRMFDAALAAAQPAACLPPHLPAPPKGRTIVIGAGKASAEMARVFERHWRAPLQGLVVTRYGNAVPCQRIAIVEAAHPVPDAAGLDAARRIRALLKGLTEDDLVVCLLSGGASALLAEPAEGLTLEDKQAINRALLASEATIAEINCVRRHLSAIKGGRLAAACWPAPVVTLLLSDLAGDDPRDIGSGPTVGDASTCADALAILRRYAINAPRAALALLESGAGESVKPGDARLARCETRLIATPQRALDAAAAVAREAGVAVHIRGDQSAGDAGEAAIVMDGMARQAGKWSQPFSPPCILVSGGQSTLTLRGKGRGGRNVEFLLALGGALDGHTGIHAIACDTGAGAGLDDVEGARRDPGGLARARALASKDGHGWSRALGDVALCRPVPANVHDFRAPKVDASATGC